jgi:hypothetical protein
MLCEAITDIAGFVASIATAIGVIFAAIQLQHSRSQAITTFEDGFAKEYRELARSIPIRALLGGELKEEDKEKSLDEFWHYFDLCNEQVFLRQIGRIRTETWVFWKDGIRSNFNKPAFQWAWEELENTKTTEYSELRRLKKTEFEQDPKSW